jgi:hypothetical protein
MTAQAFKIVEILETKPQKRPRLIKACQIREEVP